MEKVFIIVFSAFLVVAGITLIINNTHENLNKFDDNYKNLNVTFYNFSSHLKFIIRSEEKSKFYIYVKEVNLSSERTYSFNKETSSFEKSFVWNFNIYKNFNYTFIIKACNIYNQCVEKIISYNN